MQMLGAYKKHPQAYLLYVEDCFLLSDNADAPYISKGYLKNDIYKLIRHNDNLFRLFIAEEALRTICF